MDSAHDLGGKQGYGPIETDAPAWRHDWERRQWALTRLLPPRAASIDAWRHGVEQIPAMAYLNLPYFGKWNLNDIALLVQSGKITLDEILTGQAASKTTPPAPNTLQASLEMVRKSNINFEHPTTAAPAFATGDRVTTGPRCHAGHTRLPAYARAASGVICAHHGAHIFPDTSADGTEHPEHLYTVDFAAPDLFPEADPRDTISLDLWESYLTAAPSE